MQKTSNTSNVVSKDFGSNGYLKETKVVQTNNKTIKNDNYKKS